MAQYRLGLKRHFDAAHRLANYEGKCASIHGHRWDVELIIEGSDLDKAGMLVDFSLLKKCLDDELAFLDHKYLNEESPFDRENPTAERIARFLYDKIAVKLPENSALYQVKVWESPDAWASYRP